MIKTTDIKYIPNLKFMFAIFYESENVPTIYGKCPECNGDIHRGGISCPDGIEGCCVSHWGYGCSNCKKVFEIK